MSNDPSDERRRSYRRTRNASLVIGMILAAGLVAVVWAGTHSGPPELPGASAMPAKPERSGTLSLGLEIVF
jgi:hypothetical protein